jgi:hypothetical protein
MKANFEITPAKFSGVIADPKEWLFCLRENESLYVWAFPGWENPTFRKPYHYIDVCQRKQAGDLDECKHKPPEIYLKIWKCHYNLRMPLYGD